MDYITGADYIGWAPYGAGTVNSNSWVVVHRDNFHQGNYQNYAVRRDNIRGLFDRRAVQIRSGSLQRAEVERITRRPMRVVALETRQVTADSRSARLVIPKEREQVVFKQISDASRKSQERQKVTIKETSSKSKVTVSSKTKVNEKDKSDGKDGKKSSTQKSKSDKSQKKKSNLSISKDFPQGERAALPAHFNEDGRRPARP